MSILWIWLILFLVILLGGFAAFLLMEWLGARSNEDEYNTLSWYIKRARRRTGLMGSIVLSAAIGTPAVWLFGHLVLELW